MGWVMRGSAEGVLHLTEAGQASMTQKGVVKEFKVLFSPEPGQG